MSSPFRQRRSPVQRASCPFVSRPHGQDARGTGCVILLLLLTATAGALGQTTKPVLRVAADPNNLPFSNNRLEVFENKIVDLVARDLRMQVEYVWRAQRRGFFRESFKNDNCDLVPGAPAHFDKALTTTPYYRSCYVFVTRKERGISIKSFDDPQLKKLKIGVQLVGDENTPPAQALGRRGIVNNVVGFTVYGDYREQNPAARIIDAVANGEVDVAVVWGPLAGYFAKKQKTALELTAVEEDATAPNVPFAFDISMAVKKGNQELRDRLNAVLEKDEAEIAAILDQYGVPKCANSTGGAP